MRWYKYVLICITILSLVVVMSLVLAPGEDADHLTARDKKNMVQDMRRETINNYEIEGCNENPKGPACKDLQDRLDLIDITLQKIEGGEIK